MTSNSCVINTYYWLMRILQITYMHMSGNLWLRDNNVIEAYKIQQFFCYIEDVSNIGGKNNSTSSKPSTIKCIGTPVRRGCIWTPPLKKTLTIKVEIMVELWLKTSNFQLNCDYNVFKSLFWPLGGNPSILQVYQTPSWKILATGLLCIVISAQTRTKLTAFISAQTRTKLTTFSNLQLEEQRWFWIPSLQQVAVCH